MDLLTNSEPKTTKIAVRPCGKAPVPVAQAAFIVEFGVKSECCPDFVWCELPVLRLLHVDSMLIAENFIYIR